eukprot:TRINITY_DN2062_c1_g1_i1.p1 TRINITY_DN2062_c1_g1~~TRINITY_DN2062_c1_g1_i1.p1  ORF type:complete len:478 (+),score=97.24 TRINITY_DN2062_c1_g1_i1:60-1493(+)
MMSHGILDSEEAKNIAVVHKTNQGYSGKDLWKLKQERPELFGAQAVESSAPAGKRPPPGFEETRELPGWLYNRERALYFQKDTGLLYCKDPVTNELYELHVGEDITRTLTVRGDAATINSSAKGPASRNVMISDLHRAAASLKLDFAHHDSPAAMFAVYDASSPSSSAAAEAAAKGLHVKLLPRLAAYRGNWQNEKLEGVLRESIELLRQEVAPESGLGLAVALQLGGRLTLAATGGAVCMLFGATSHTDGSIDNLEVVGQSFAASTHCVVLDDSHLGAILTVEGARKAIPSTRMRALARTHVLQERPKAACITVLEQCQKAGADAPLVAACIRFSWIDANAPAKKRAKMELAGVSKVRCRHILLRHVGAQQVIGDRRAKPTRSLVMAEQQMLALLMEISSTGGASAFTAKCKAMSECDTALRGGDLAGDLGWLEKDPSKNKKVPAAVIRAAFQLSVNQISDLVVSERGLHLILRTA